MNTSEGLTRPLPGDGLHNSVYGEILIPMIVAAVPAMLFLLLGLITQGMDVPGAKIPLGKVLLMIVVQTVGIVSMAVVVLIRFGIGSEMLRILSNGQPKLWRKCALISSIVCLLLFDISTNVAAAFAGAGFLLTGAIPAFFAYVFCNRIAFKGLGLPLDSPA